MFNRFPSQVGQTIFLPNFFPIDVDDGLFLSSIISERNSFNPSKSILYVFLTDANLRSTFNVSFKPFITSSISTCGSFLKGVLLSTLCFTKIVSICFSIREDDFNVSNNSSRLSNIDFVES